MYDEDNMRALRIKDTSESDPVMKKLMQLKILLKLLHNCEITFTCNNNNNNNNNKAFI